MVFSGKQTIFFQLTENWIYILYSFFKFLLDLWFILVFDYQSTRVQQIKQWTWKEKCVEPTSCVTEDDCQMWLYKKKKPSIYQDITVITINVYICNVVVVVDEKHTHTQTLSMFLCYYITYYIFWDFYFFQCLSQFPSLTLFEWIRDHLWNCCCCYIYGLNW